LDYQGWIRDALQSLSKHLVPTEVVLPPLPDNQLSLADSLSKELSTKGAVGTFGSTRFAFGCHLNPEIENFDKGKIIKTVKAFIVMTDWLRSQIQVDITRSMSLYAADFPVRYQIKVLNPKYAPTWEKFVSDYLRDNATRNRALDLLPLIKHFSPELLANSEDDQLVKARPTYHYRLPNCQLGSEFWSVPTEYKRWRLVEQLASTDKLDVAARCTLKAIADEGDFGKNEWRAGINSLVEEIRNE